MKEDADWLKLLQSQAEKGESEFPLASLRPGDRLFVVTAHTNYQFTMLTDRDAILETNRADRPSGRVRIHGCAFGASETIKPDHLFCGGSLEFQFTRDGISKVQRTTPVLEIRHIGSSRPPAGGTQPSA